MNKTRKSFETEVTLGCVLVFVPVFDGEGGMRSISFPRPGNQWGLRVNYHWTCEPHFSAAKRIAAAELKRIAAK